MTAQSLNFSTVLVTVVLLMLEVEVFAIEVNFHAIINEPDFLDSQLLSATWSSSTVLPRVKRHAGISEGEHI